MKRMIALLLLVTLLTGCANAPAPLPPSELEGSPYCQTTYTNTGFVETPSATYVVWEDRSLELLGSHIRVRAKGTDSFVPLCSKPNCGHKDRNCNSVSGMALGLYRDRLYTVTESMDSIGSASDLISMALDGTDRRVEMTIPWLRQHDGSRSGDSGEFFHLGRLVLFFDPDYGAPLDAQVFRIQVVDLGTKQITEPFAEYLTSDMQLSSLVRMADRYLYTTVEYRQPDGSVDTWRVQMDLLSGEIKKLFAIENNGQWYDESYVDDKAVYWHVPGEGFYEYDLATGETVCKGMPVPELFNVMWDENWIYGSPAMRDEPGKRALYVLDRNYELVDTLPLPDFMALKYVDHEKLYFGIWLQYGDELITAAADRGDIGTGKLTLNIQKEVEFVDILSGIEPQADAS